MPKHKKRRLFAAMPFGVKTGHFKHDLSDELQKVNFDDIWEHLLKPAIPAREFIVTRADEFTGSHIEKEYVDWLRTADVVLADLTFGNANVYYELGLRYALSRFGTVLIADSRTELPFDTRQFRMITYEPGNFGKIDAFKKKLRQTLRTAHTIESPVYTYQPGLFVAYYDDLAFPDATIDKLRDENERLQRERDRVSVSSDDQRMLPKIQANFDKPQVLLRLFGLIQNNDSVSPNVLEELGRNLTKSGRLDESIEALERAERRAPEDPEVLRELAFAYRKKGETETDQEVMKEYYSRASKYFHEALELNPHDLEAQGMYGGLLKRLGDLSGAKKRYELAYKLDPTDLYAAITVANMAASLGATDDATRGFREVIRLANQEIESGKESYWTYLSLGESHAALGDKKEGVENFKIALQYKPPAEDVRSSYDQMILLAKGGFRPKEYSEILREASLRTYIE